MNDTQGRKLMVLTNYHLVNSENSEEFPPECNPIKYVTSGPGQIALCNSTAATQKLSLL